MNASNQRQLTPVLTVIAVLLGALLLLLLSGVGRGVTWDAPRTLATLPSTGNATNLPQPLPLQQFVLIWQKPLFSPDRKPVAHVADGGSNLGDLTLTGIILTPAVRLALLHDKNGDKQVRLREGESLPDGSVKLVEVRPRSALFDSSAGRTELKLPAGAPIDDKRAGASANAGDMNPAGGSVMRVEPGSLTPAPAMAPVQQPTPDNAQESALERLRKNIKNIQKRRAASAAAANAGVR